LAHHKGQVIAGKVLKVGAVMLSVDLNFCPQGYEFPHRLTDIVYFFDDEARNGRVLNQADLWMGNPSARPAFRPKNWATS
jgi:hypothetical protein